MTYDVVIPSTKGGKLTMFLISLDELDRIKRLNHLYTAVDLADRTGLSRNTWNIAMKTRRPTPQVLEALARLGADPTRVLVRADEYIDA